MKDLYTATAGTKVNASRNVIPGSTLQSGLVGLWSFDGKDMNWRTNKALDRSGQGNDGELVNMSTSTSPVSGKIGQALQFGYNGTKNINAGSASILDNVIQKTICAWINPVSFGSIGNGSNIYGKGSASNDGPTFGLSDDDGQGLYFQQKFSNGSFYVGHTGAGTITLNTWQHVCVSYDNSSISNDATLYIDGASKSVTESDTPTGGSATDDSANSVAIGNYYPGYSGSFDGTLDDVRIYNRALSPAEVKLLYNVGR